MEKERLRQVEREKERLRQIELEKERLRQVEREKERLRQIELEKERLRQIELEKERLRQIELEKERLRQIALEKERQREIQKQVELEKERLRQISMEKERLRQIAMEKERQREIQKQVELDKKRLRQVEMEKDRQWQKDSERQTEEEKEKQKQKKTELENKRLQETERQKEVERERQREQQWKKLSEMEREDAGAPKRLKMLEAEEQLFRPRATYFALTGQIQESTLLGESIDGPELPFTDSSAGSGKWSSQRRVTTLRRNPSLDAAFRGGGVAVWTEEAELKGEQARERERGTGARSLKESAVDLAAELENPRQKLLELQRHTEEELERQKLREANMELEGQLELHGQKEKADGQWQAWPGRSEKGREPEGAPMQEAGRRLRPQVLDVDTVSLRDRHSTGSPSGSWRQPSVGPEGLYHMAVLDVDSFRSQKVLGADVRDLSTTPRPQPTLHGQAGVPPRTTGRTDLMWTPCHLELWGQAEEKPSMVLTPLPPSKSPGSWLAPDPPPKVAHKANLEQLLQRHPERLPKPGQAPEQCRSGVSAEASVPEAHSPGRLARASPEHSLWALETAVERGGVQRRQNLQAKDVSRMRSRSVSRRPAPAESSLDGPLSRMRSRSAHRESGRQTWEQLKRCTSSEAEGKDTDTLVHETDSQYGTWETGLHTEDSLTPATPTSDSILSSSSRKPTPPHTPGEARSPDPHQEAELLPFPETSTTLLDSSALRSRVQLSKKRSRRTLPSRSARHSATLSMLQEGAGEPGQDWMYRDSTEEKAEPSNQDDSDSEEPLRPSEPRLSSSQPQRVALFPGMDPSALKAQLKKRGDTDDQTNGPAPTQLSRSPKSPFLSRASRVLPPAAGKENEEESSPQWLKELKSKKRLSQYEHEA